MKLESSRKADEMHRKNLHRIRELISEFEDPRTSQERRGKIKETFQQIIDHADKVQKQDSLFFRMAKKVNDNGHKGE